MVPLQMQYFAGDLYPNASGSTTMLTLPPVPVQADIDQYNEQQISQAADSHATITAVQNGQSGGVLDSKTLWVALGGILLLLVILHF